MAQDMHYRGNPGYYPGSCSPHTSYHLAKRSSRWESEKMTFSFQQTRGRTTAPSRTTSSESWPITQTRDVFGFRRDRFTRTFASRQKNHGVYEAWQGHRSGNSDSSKKKKKEKKMADKVLISDKVDLRTPQPTLTISRLSALRNHEQVKTKRRLRLSRVLFNLNYRNCHFGRISNIRIQRHS